MEGVAKNQEALFLLVSCGPGGEDCLTPEARKAVESADLLAGASRLFSLFPGITTPRIALDGGVEPLLAALAPFAGVKRVAVLVSGDAGLHSLARGVLERFGRSNCRVIPGVSSVQVACARLGVPWQSAKILNLHHQSSGPEGEVFAEGEVLVILAGPHAPWPWISALASRYAGTCSSFLLQDLTLPEERIEVFSPLASPGGENPYGAVSPRTIVVLIRKERL